MHLAFQLDLLFVLNELLSDRRGMRENTPYAIRGVPFRQTSFTSAASDIWSIFGDGKRDRKSGGIGSGDHGGERGNELSILNEDE